MAGHSKWANIQHRKGAQDKKRARAFGKLIRELTVAARIGGADPDSNPRLRLAVERARAQNMPRDTLERAVQRGAGQLEGAEIQEVTYEGYGPGGVAVLVTCMTDNRNRTVAEVRHAFGRHGGNLGAEGSVGYLFNEVGLLGFPAGVGEEALMEAALAAGAEDVVTDADGNMEVLTDPQDFLRVRQALEVAGLVPEHAEVTRRSVVRTPLAGQQAEALVQLIDALDELDDVQHVYTNADLPAELLAPA